MADVQLPSEAEFNAFMGKVHEFRGGLSAGDQKILDAIIGAAMGHKEEEDVKPYWVAVGPRGGVAAGYGAVAVSPYAATYGAYYG